MWVISVIWRRQGKQGAVKAGAPGGAAAGDVEVSFSFGFKIFIRFAPNYAQVLIDTHPPFSMRKLNKIGHFLFKIQLWKMSSYIQGTC